MIIYKITNQINNKWGNVNYAVVEDRNNNAAFGTSSIFPIPSKYVDDIKKHSLSFVMDKIFAQKDTGRKYGGIRNLTNNAYTRADLVKDAFVMALTSIANDYWR